MTALNIIEPNTKYKQAEVRGGLLFEKDVEKPVIVNPNYITYKRKLILKDIFRAVDLAERFLNEYQKYCEAVKDSQFTKTVTKAYSYKLRYTATDNVMPIYDATKACNKLNLTLPKIETWSDVKDLRLFATDNNITKVYLNFTYDEKTNTIKYRDTDTKVNSALNNMIILNHDNTETHTTKNDMRAITAWKDGPDGYIELRDNTWFVRNWRHKDNKKDIREKVICLQKERIKPEQEGYYLLDVAAHL